MPFPAWDGEGKSMEQVGIIYGDVETARFRFSIMSHIEKTEYVQMEHEKCGWVLGMVDDIERKTDLDVERVKQMSSGESVDIGENVIGKVTIVGYRDSRGLLQVPHTPFKAGTKVYKADELLIEKVIGLSRDEKTGAYLGLLSGHNIRVYQDINSLVQKHVCVLAKSGGGKSYLVGVLIEELMKHNVTCVIIDPHGEYASMKFEGKAPQTTRSFGVTQRSYTSQIIEYSPDVKINPEALPLKFTFSNLDAREILALTSIKDVRAYMVPLKKAMEAARLARETYTVRDLMQALDADEEGIGGSLTNELAYIEDTDVFVEKGTLMTDLVRQKKTTIINLKGVPPDIQGLVVNRICTALFELRKQNKVPPLMLVIEEAHNYCPQQGVAASSKVLRTIASEGRKFGLGLCVITQRAAKVDKNVLSQCNTQIILKVTNPIDLKAIAASVEGLTEGMEDEIQALPTGTAIIASGNFSVPLFVDIRPRETKHGGEAVKVIEEDK